MSVDAFHPAVGRWFRNTFDAPTPSQERGWPAIRAGRHTLIAAPTGSGKTLAAFLASIDDLVRQGLAGGLEDGTQVVYVSPLKALSNDIHQNLEIPLRGIADELVESGDPDVGIRTAVRTGDTTQAQRRAMVKRPPHILVTTPESLYILLTSAGGRDMLRSARTAIVDEIHAVAGDKRGSHLALTLERLEHLVDGDLLRIGLSATQRPIDRVARFLVGAGNLDARGEPDCTIVDVGTHRDLDLHVEMPRSPLEAVMASEVWEEVYDRVAALIEEHRTTLVFVNTRRITERVTKHLAERLGEEVVGAHHGSLSKEQRLEAERRLRSGDVKALVATASLELGIDIGAVDLVVQLGSPRSISTLLQRVGRASHHVGGRPEGRLFPLSRDELVECVALVHAARRGELDRLVLPDKPVDILAQQIVACAASRDWGEAELYDLVRRAWPFRELSRAEFDEVVEMLARGFTTRRGRRGAYLHWDAVNGVVRGRRGARLTAITCGGAIPDTFEFQVVQEPHGIQVGTVDEEFSVESLPGDIFQLGNTSWRILKVEGEKVLVEDARGQPPTIPFWFGEAPGRTRELSEAVSRVREEVAARLAAGEEGADAAGREAAIAWLVDDVGIGEVAARALVEYLAVAATALGTMPSRETLVIERFFDEAGDMHLVVHSPYGQRVNRAWGLALRKVFCRTFNFELQAAATDDAVVLSLGPTHSFPLDDVFDYLKPGRVREQLVQAFLDAPMFPVRWRWNASRSLAIKRFYGGRRVPPQLQRMDAEDLLAVIFPDQLACLENVQGDREIPDHPLVEQTIRDCLEEAMDFEEFAELLERIAERRVGLLARDVREPSPMAHEVLAARPYAFLDDAPAEERRTLAVQTRRFLDVDGADDLGALDAGAVTRVCREAWPEPEGTEELHDALVLHGYLTHREASSEGWGPWLRRLAGAGRVARLEVPAGEGASLWVAAERIPELRAVYGPEAAVPSWRPQPELPDRLRLRQWSSEEALKEVVRGRLLALGPLRVPDVAGEMGLGERRVEGAMLALEAEGFVFRGRFTSRAEGEEWCERGLLARIHRYTLNRLRSEIEPVSRGDLMHFLLAWHRLLPGERAQGPESLEAILEQLEGFEAAAAAWEGEILPARLRGYDPVWLDTLCLSGRFAWARLSPPSGGPRSGGRGGPVRSTPVALLSRERMPRWLRLAAGVGDGDGLSSGARQVFDALREDGASFFADLGRRCRLLPGQLEEALGELVAHGLVTADGFTGLRALLVPSSRKTRKRSRRSGAIVGMEDAGRWALLERDGAGAVPAADDVEAVARSLLRRYGVVFRRLLHRETSLPPWRDLLRVYHRLEARGDIRGGRFVAGFSGQQFALPDAVGRLRAVRRRRRDEAGEAPTLVSISAADPLNLLGIVTSGERLPAVTGNRVLFRDGVPLAIRRAGEVRFLEEVEAAGRWKLKKELVRRRVPPRLRAYLGRPA